MNGVAVYMNAVVAHSPHTHTYPHSPYPGAALKQFHYAGDTPRQVAGLTELAKHSFESVVIRKPGQGVMGAGLCWGVYVYIHMYMMLYMLYLHMHIMLYIYIHAHDVVYTHAHTYTCTYTYA